MEHFALDMTYSAAERDTVPCYNVYPIHSLAKPKACNTCIAPQAVYRNCRGAVHVTD